MGNSEGKFNRKKLMGFFSKHSFISSHTQTEQTGRDAGVVELARLESEYTSKRYRGFESPSLRQRRKSRAKARFFVFTPKTESPLSRLREEKQKNLCTA
jgi:hypothetical protein